MPGLQPRNVKGYGWRPGTPDHRDLTFDHEAHAQGLAVNINGAFTLRPKMPPIYQQAHLGSCTGNGTAAILEYIRRLEGHAFDTPSRLFIYYYERVLEGTVSSDAGAEVRDGLKVLATLGCPPEALWPYSDQDPGPFQQEPSPQACQAARRDLALAYETIVPGHGAIRVAIAAGIPVVFGFPVPDTFESPDWNPATQHLPVPGPDNQIIGGHCVVAQGFDWTCTRFPEPVFDIRNSWGADWGDHGSFYMSAGYMRGDQALASDFWVLRKTS